MKRTQVVFRLFFGVLLLTTAIGKLLDNRGFAEVIATYQLGIPEPLLLPLGLAVSLLELGMALAIFAGVALAWMAQGTIAMHAFYAGMAAITNLRGLELTNCGCFGVFLARPMTWTTVLEDVVLTLLSVAFYLVVRSTGTSAAARTPGSDAAPARRDADERGADAASLRA